MPFQLATEQQLQYQQPPPQRPSYDQPIVMTSTTNPTGYTQYPSPPPTPRQQYDEDHPNPQSKKRKIDEEAQENQMDSFKLSLQLLRDRIELLENKTNDVNHIKCDIRLILDSQKRVEAYIARTGFLLSLTNKDTPQPYNSDDETDGEEDKLSSKHTVAPKQIPIK